MVAVHLRGLRILLKGLVCAQEYPEGGARVLRADTDNTHRAINNAQADFELCVSACRYKKPHLEGHHRYPKGAGN